MEKTWTIEDIKDLIHNEIEESRNLEYKGARALSKTDGKTNEISKDVSSFANANGGIIIYGIKEYDEKGKNHLPERIDPIDRTKFSKEWLEHIINSKIQPKIKGVEIDPVSISESEVVYVVKIPKSTTAHQSSGHKYYKRYNFEAVPMEDYEVRDVMNRLTHPDVELEFEIEHTIKTRSGLSAGIGVLQTVGDTNKAHKILKIFIRNKGSVYANYVNYYLVLNRNILLNEERVGLRAFSKDNSGRIYVEYYGENTVRDIISTKGIGLDGTPYYEYGPSRFDPILPGGHSRPDRIMVEEDIESLFQNEVISWKVFADNAEPKEGDINISDIKVVQTTT